MGGHAFLFTGQGAQYANMGKDLYEKYNIFKNTFDEASEYLKINLPEICADTAELSKTHNAQAAIFAVSYGIYKILTEDYNIMPDCAAGFSLGEITSLAASGVLTFKDALGLIKARGGAMQAACEHKPGAMYGVLGADDALVEEVCSEISKKNKYVIPANYNCPGQAVISGETEAVEEAAGIFAEKKIKTIKLNVAGAFHTKLMTYKQGELAEFLETLDFNLPKFDLYSNVTGKKFDFDKFDKSDNKNIKPFMTDYITKQMSNPVRFREELENIKADGCDIFTEIGAGKALSGFVKRTCGDVKILNAQDVISLEAAVAALKN